MLTPRLRKILRVLLDKNEAISAKELAGTLLVSLRSIRYDLKAIKEMEPEFEYELISIPGKGISLRTSDPGALKEKLVGLDSYQAPLAPEERQKRTLVSLLLSKQRTPEDIAEEFSVSLGTVYRDVKLIEMQLHGLELVKSGGKLEIRGPELKKREVLAELLSSLSDDIDELGMRWFTDLPTGDSAAVNRALKFSQKALGYKLADSSYLALYIHLLIALQRVRSGHRIVIDEDLHKNITRNPEYKVACELAGLMYGMTGIQLPEAELGHIAIHLLGSKVRERPDGQDDRKLKRTILSFVKTFESVYGISGLSSDQKLLADLAMHLRPALKRISYKLPVKNPLLDRLRLEFSEVFQSARESCRQLPETESLDEAELGFLVMHLAAAIERLKQPDTIKAVVICSTGLGSARLLSERISRRFPNIEVIAVASALERDFPQETQVVISTVPLSLPIPVVQVSPLLVGAEVAKLERFIFDSQTQLHSHAALDSILGAIRRNCIIIDEANLLAELQTCLGISTPATPEGLKGLASAIKELEQAFGISLSPNVINGLMIHFIYTAKRLQEGNFWQDPELEKEKANPKWEAVKAILQRRFSEWELPWSDHELPPVFRYFDLEG